MIKRITVDTNSDIYNEAENLYIEIINNETSAITLEYPTFTEILANDDITPTGIYSVEIDLGIGNYYITVKHNTITKSGSVHFIVTETDEHETLENTIIETVDDMDVDDSTSFA